MTGRSSSRSGQPGQRPIRVCHITPIPPEEYSGATFHALWLAQKLYERGVHSEFVAFPKARGTSQRTAEEFVVHHLWRPPGKSPELMMWPQLLWFFKRHREFDVVHVHGCGAPSAIISLAASFAHMASIATIMLEGFDPAMESRLLGPIIARMVHRFDRVVAISDEIHEMALNASLEPSQLVKIPIGVDVDRFHPIERGTRKELRARHGLPPDQPVVSFVGALCNRKNVLWLLDTWIRGPIPEECVLLVVGDADDDVTNIQIRNQMQDRIRSAHCEIHWIPFVREIEEIYALSDVFVLPSLAEGMANVILQAMASAVPVITTPVSGAVELVGRESQRGWLFDFNSREQFMEGLHTLLACEARRVEMGQLARKHVVAHYSLDSVSRRYYDLYSELVDRHCS